MKRTGRKWSIAECRVCEKPHRGYSGKLDAKGIEYVVCTNKRMNVNLRFEGDVRQSEWYQDNPPINVHGPRDPSDTRWKTDKCSVCGHAHESVPATLSAGGSEFVTCGGVEICVSLSWTDGDDGTFESSWTMDRTPVKEHN